MRARFVVGITGAVGALAFAIACGGGENQSSTGEAKVPQGSRSEAVEHESCEEAGHQVQQLDATGDGRPDIKRVFAGGKEICRISDLNHDGRADLWEYYDASGQLRRREADYDDNGVVNAIEYFENGKLTRKEMDTTGQHRIDTWDFFDPASGKRLRRERDTTNDGRVDQWWTWDGDKVTIAMDKSGDGKPDPETTLTIGGSDAKDNKDAKDGGLAAAADAAPAAPAPPTPSSPDLDAGPSPSPAATDTDAGAAGDGGAKRRRGSGGGKK